MTSTQQQTSDQRLDGSAWRPLRHFTNLFPRRLVEWTGWALGLIIMGTAVWLGSKVVSFFAVVVVSSGAAMLFVALLHPVDRFFRRLHFPRALAAICAVIALLVVLGGLGFLIENSIANQFNRLVTEFSQSLTNLRDTLMGTFPISSQQLTQLQNEVVSRIQNAGSAFASAAVTVGRVAVDAVAGLVLGLFLVIFLLWDGAGVWNWFRGLFPKPAAERLYHAGEAAWSALTGFIQGTFIIACIHGVVIGVVLYLLGVDLFLPLAVGVFLGSFIPIVGAFIAGGFAVIVTLGLKGLIPALIMLAVLLFENELESHVLQPFIVGRYVRLHPIAIVIVLTVGSYWAGMAGALFAVPFAGVLRASWGPLNGKESVVRVREGPSRMSRLWRWLKSRFHRAGQTSESSG